MDSDIVEYDAAVVPAGLGVFVHAPPGNVIRIHPEASNPQLHIVMGGTGNIITLDAGCNVEGAIRLEGSNNLVTLHGGPAPQRLQATLYEGDTLIWGRACTAYGVRIWVHGGQACEVGDGCLFSENIQIRTTDHHSIIDLDTLETINAPSDVRVGNRVWVGEGVSIGKGVTIGDGSIIGSRAYVNRSVPSKELWAGVPARPLRQNVSWVHQHPCTPEQAAAVMT